MILLGPLVTLGLSLATAGFEGQEPAPTVRMHALRPGDTVYILMDGGGHSIALADEASGGVVLIDTKRMGYGRTILDAVAFVTDLPVTTIINTHAHQEHIGSNAEFQDVTQIIAHENARAAMEEMGAFRDDAAIGLPNTTYGERMTLLGGPNRIELYHFGAAHTNGDTIVVFPDKNLAHLGDLVIDRALPYIDTSNGGSGTGYPRTLAKVVAGIQGVDTVITGHSALPSVPGVQGMLQTMNWGDVREYAEFTGDFVDAVQTAYNAGLSAEQAVATLQLPEAYADYDLARAGANVRIIYDELRMLADIGQRPGWATDQRGRTPLLHRVEF